MEEKINEMLDFVENRDELLQVSTELLAGVFANKKSWDLCVEDAVNASVEAAKKLIQKVNESCEEV